MWVAESLFLLAASSAQSASTAVVDSSCDLAAFTLAQSEKRQRLISETKTLLEEVKDLGRQRAVVAEQRTRVVRMNPIGRGIKSTFDAKYDLAALDRLERDLASRMQITGQRSTILKAEADLLDLERQQFLERCGYAQN